MEQRKIDDKDLERVAGGTIIEEVLSPNTRPGDGGKTVAFPEPVNPGMPNEIETDANSGPGGTGTVDFNR